MEIEGLLMLSLVILAFLLKKVFLAKTITTILSTLVGVFSNSCGFTIFSVLFTLSIFYVKKWIFADNKHINKNNKVIFLDAYHK
ncbi:hypothetical protein [Clostridium oceanicum]